MLLQHPDRAAGEVQTGNSGENWGGRQDHRHQVVEKKRSPRDQDAESQELRAQVQREEKRTLAGTPEYAEKVSKDAKYPGQEGKFGPSEEEMRKVTEGINEREARYRQLSNKSTNYRMAAEALEEELRAACSSSEEEQAQSAANRQMGPPAPCGRNEGFPAGSVFDPARFQDANGESVGAGNFISPRHVSFPFSAQAAAFDDG